MTTGSFDVGVGAGVDVAVGFFVTDGLAVGRLVGEALAEGDVLRVGFAVLDAETLGVAEALTVGDCVGVAVAVALGDGCADAAALADSS